MASWMVHLRIAEQLLDLIPNLDAAQFAIGNIAPDSGLPDENWENFDPPKTVTHFKHEGINAPFRHDDFRFYHGHLKSVSPDERERFSFLLGYFFHLIVDNLWILEIWRPTKGKYLSLFETRKELNASVKKDWYGLDFAYVRSHAGCLFWRVFVPATYDVQYLEFFPEIAIPKQLDYIKTFYQRQDTAIEENFRLRDNIYLAETEMQQFIDRAVQTLMAVYQKIWFEEIEIEEQTSSLEIV